MRTGDDFDGFALADHPWVALLPVVKLGATLTTADAQAILSWCGKVERQLGAQAVMLARYLGVPSDLTSCTCPVVWTTMGASDVRNLSLDCPMHGGKQQS